MKYINAYAISIVVLIGSAAHAQIAGDAAASPGELADIVVTAQKRSESLMKVPLSLSAETGEDLQSKGITRIEQLGLTTPGLSINNATGTTQMYMRGIGNSLYAETAESSVALYIDDVPRPSSASGSDLSNIERIEVLKGPQGALYGRNASGGAINIITRQPSDVLESKAQMSYGEYRTTEAYGYLNVPVAGLIDANLAITRRFHDPYVHNLSTGGDNFNQDFWSVDGKVKFNLPGQLSATIAADYQDKNDANGFGWQQRDYATTLAYYGGLRAAFGLPPLPPGYTLQENLNRHQITADERSISKVIDYGVSLHAGYDLDTFALTFVSSYRKSSAAPGEVEIDATSAPIAGFTSAYYVRTQTNELRAASTGNSPFHWLVGASSFRSRGLDNVYGVVLGIRSPAFDLHADQLDKAYALFSQISYDFTDKFSLIGSLRYAHENKAVVYPGQVATGGVAYFGGLTEKKVLPSLTANFNLTPDQLIYVRAARGYKSGGLNTLLNPAAVGGVVNQFSPEIVDTIEAGYKATLFNRRVQLTTAIFLNNIKDLQVARTGGPGVTNYVLNAKKARSDGIEANLTWRAADPITLSAGIAYTNSRYVDYASPGIARLQILPFNNDGKQMQFTPRWSGNLDAELAQPISANLVLAGTMNVAFKSRFNLEAQGNPLVEVNSYAVVNGRIGVRTADQKVGLYFFARNLLDKAYYQSGQQNAAGVLTTYAPPRVLGGTIEVQF